MRLKPIPTSHPIIRALIAGALLLPIAGLPLIYPDIQPSMAIRS
jgi:hypothetical protein